MYSPPAIKIPCGCWTLAVLIALAWAVGIVFFAWSILRG